MKYHFKVHRQKQGFWADCVELKGCHTQANTESQLLCNLRETLNLFLDEPANSKLIYPLPYKKLKGKNILTVEVDPNIAFAFHLRRTRLKHCLTQREAALAMGFKNLYSYQRLENAKTANPELKTIIQIKRIFPDFSVDEVLAA